MKIQWVTTPSAVQCQKIVEDSFEEYLVNLLAGFGKDSQIHGAIIARISHDEYSISLPFSGISEYVDSIPVTIQKVEPLDRYLASVEVFSGSGGYRMSFPLLHIDPIILHLYGISCKHGRSRLKWFKSKRGISWRNS